MFRDSLQLLALNLMPQRTISRIVGRFARSPLSKPIIPIYIKRFDIDMSQAEKTADDFATLTDFFIRRLKPGLRPIATGAKTVVSPVDGKVSAMGKITAGRLWQVKGVTYSLRELLNGDDAMTQRYQEGDFITIYLSPQDYHRIHMPLGGKLVKASYIAGSLFPVNPFAVRAVSNLFSRNERLITYAETQAGMMALIKVGATIVGSVKVVYGDMTTNIKEKSYSRDLTPPPRLAKGDEVGRFEFGSTVILLFEKNRVKLRHFKTDEVVLLGQPIGEMVS